MTRISAACALLSALAQARVESHAADHPTAAATLHSMAALKDWDPNFLPALFHARVDASGGDGPC